MRVKSKEVRVYLDPKTKSLLKKKAKQMGVAQTEIMRRALLLFLADEDKNKKAFAQTELDLLQEIKQKTEKAALYGAAAFVLQKAKFAMRLQGYAPEEMENLEKAMDKVLEVAKNLLEED